MIITRKRLNQSGFSLHVILPAIVVVVIGSVGAYMITKSKAANLPSNSSSKTIGSTQTPLKKLTTIISNLKNGSQVDVTSASVTVPGPITDAQARPIVFSANGKKYFAYTQGTPPNFSLTAAQTASTMAIVKATVNNPSLVLAHLDKADNLVDPDFILVGYSTGGN